MYWSVTRLKLEPEDAVAPNFHVEDVVEDMVPDIKLGTYTTSFCESMIALHPPIITDLKELDIVLPHPPIIAEQQETPQILLSKPPPINEWDDLEIDPT